MNHITDREYAAFIEALYEQGEFETQEVAVKTLQSVKDLFDIDEDCFSSRSAIIRDAAEWSKDHPVIEVEDDREALRIEAEIDKAKEEEV